MEELSSRPGSSAVVLQKLLPSWILSEVLQPEGGGEGIFCKGLSHHGHGCFLLPLLDGAGAQRSQLPLPCCLSEAGPSPAVCSHTCSPPRPPPLPAAFSISHRTPSRLPVGMFAHLCAEPGQGADPGQKNSLQLCFSFQLEGVLSGFLGGCTSTWAGIREGRGWG